MDGQKLYHELYKAYCLAFVVDVTVEKLFFKYR
jgi:hypothetical protein